MIGIAQRDIARIPTVYGDLQKDDRIHHQGRMATVAGISVLDAVVITTLVDDQGNRICRALPKTGTVVRSARATRD